MLWGAIKQYNQSIARFKLCSRFYQPPHPMQICCPKTNFLNQITSFYYSTFKTCSYSVLVDLL
jgi:hypothetical protein